MQRPEDFNDEAMERRTSEPRRSPASHPSPVASHIRSTLVARLDDADNAAVFGTTCTQLSQRECQSCFCRTDVGEFTMLSAMQKCCVAYACE